jgi:hypothetical protein
MFYNPEKESNEKGTELALLAKTSGNLKDR